MVCRDYCIEEAEEANLVEPEKTSACKLVGSVSEVIGPLPKKRRQFELDHQEWFSEQNARFEKHGLWCDDMRVTEQETGDPS